MPRHLRHACLALLATFPASPAWAATQEVQGWAAQAISFKASPRNIVTIDVSERARSDTDSGGEQFLGRVSIDHEIAPKVQIGGGFAYLKSQVDQEMRLFQQITATHGILQSRTRLEQRFFDTLNDPGWRLRERVQASIPLDKAKQWTLVAATEFFFQLNRARPSDKTGLAVMRQQVGLRHPLSKAVDIQLLYMRQQSFRDGRPDIVAHVPWLSLNWRI